MNLPLVLSQMIPSRKPIQARPVAANNRTSVASNARMNLLVSIQLELAFV
jgi:hypothetical protein